MFTPLQYFKRTSVIFQRRLYAFACYLQDIILFLLFFQSEERRDNHAHFLVSPKFIFSPGNWITFYIIQNSKTH